MDDTKYPRWMLLPTCAQYIDRTEGAVTMLVYRCRIPFVRQSGRLYFDRLEIDKWMNQGRRRAPMAGKRRTVGAKSTPKLTTADSESGEPETASEAISTLLRGVTV